MSLLNKEDGKWFMSSHKGIGGNREERRKWLVDHSAESKAACAEYVLR